MSSRFQERETNQSPMNSPRNSNVSSTITNTNTNTNNCLQIPTSPLTPRTITTPRSDSNPYPTTFVQADTSTFKHVVQMLTGSSDTNTNTNTKTQPPPSQQHQQDLLSLPLPPPPSRSFNIPPKKQGFKLYERRNNTLMMKNNNTLMINTLMPNYAQNNIITTNNNFSPRKPPEILSPSLLDFPSLALSPVTPLNDDPFDKSSSSPYSLGNSSSSEEDKAIAEKGFYLHPSPRTTSSSSSSTPNNPPQLLPLFPLTSPRVSESSSSS